MLSCLSFFTPLVFRRLELVAVSEDFIRDFDRVLFMQFGYGQSNPTFLLEVGSGASVVRYVLRKKPPGKLLESAHAIEREFQVIFRAITTADLLLFTNFLLVLF